MISQPARDGFDHLLTRALQASLTPSDGQPCDINVVAGLDGAEASTMVVLTVSSYLFRLIVMLHFSSDRATREYVARVNRIAPDDMNEQSFHDAIAECGNICCGILNRDLGAIFPHIGMSTPNMIDTRCAAYLGMLNSGHIQHFEVGVEGAPMFRVSLCVCDYADLDFTIDVNDAGAETGELELF
jgi:hypothetical protein